MPSTLSLLSSSLSLSVTDSVALWPLLLANGTGGTGPLSVSAVDTAGTLGLLIYQPFAQQLIYCPDGFAFGPSAATSDSFGYTLSDANGATVSGSVTVTETADSGLTVLQLRNGATKLAAPGTGYLLVGGNGADTLLGSIAGGVAFMGGNGNDTIKAGGSGNKIYAGAGNNVIGVLDNTAGGNNLIEFGSGNNFVQARGSNVTVYGGNGANTLNLASDGSVVVLGDGNNSVFDRGMNAQIALGDGNNAVTVANSATVVLGDGNNTVTIVGTGTTVTAGDGDNTIVAGFGWSTLSLGSGGNTVFIQGGHTTVTVTGSCNKILACGDDNVIRTGEVAGMMNRIQLRGSGNFVDAGAGQNEISDGAGQNGFALDSHGKINGDGITNIGRFTLTKGDWFDFSKALAGTDFSGDLTSIGNFLSVSMVGNDAHIGIDPTGHAGAGYDIAVLRGTGPITFGDLVSHGAVYVGGQMVT